jgi:hypothetical protein
MMTVLFVLSGSTLSNALSQIGDNKPLTDLPRQYAATAFGQTGSMAGKSFGVNTYITAWTTDQQVQDFISVLKEKGPDGDVGRLSPTGLWVVAFALPGTDQQRTAACTS